MPSPGPKYVSLRAHAGTAVAGSPGNSASSFAARQTSSLCVVELLLKF
jgi:hypothetical protein